MRRQDRLSTQDLKFVEVYTRTRNASRSYQVAFGQPNRHSAKVSAFRLLRRQSIIDKIEEVQSDFRFLGYEHGLHKKIIVEALKKIIYDDNIPAKLRAIMIWARLVGDYPPPKIIYKYEEVEEDEEDISSLNEAEKEVYRRKLIASM